MKTLLILAFFAVTACDVAGTEEARERELRFSGAAVGTATPATATIEVPVAYSFNDGALFRQNFETSYTPVGSTWWGTTDPIQVNAYTAGGISGRILQVTYIPDGSGTHSIDHLFAIPSVTQATLSYDVKFDSDFVFMLAGKLPGLAGGSVTTGCGPVEPDGWSVRVLWNEVSGTIRPSLYVYDQDRLAGHCGDTYSKDNFVFQTGTWYRVDLEVQMNTTGVYNGWAKLWVEGTLVAETPSLKLRNTTAINRFLFNTFYGGNGPEYNPPHETHAYFDNFTVRPGFSESGTKGTSCEITEEGIYNVGAKVCCAEGCAGADDQYGLDWGGCGGSGCASLPPGAAGCCTGTILTSGNVCTQSGVSAPCYYP